MHEDPAVDYSTVDKEAQMFELIVGLNFSQIESLSENSTQRKVIKDCLGMGFMPYPDSETLPEVEDVAGLPENLRNSLVYCIKRRQIIQ